MRHELKCWPEYFQAVWVGVKDFEIRKNDRDFKVYDEVVIKEYDPKEDDYTGRKVEGIILYVTSFRQRTGYCVFNFEITGREE